MKALILLLLYSTICLTASAQSANDPLHLEPSMQPTVMVIPFAKKGEDLRTKFEHEQGAPIRAALSVVKNGLNQKGIQSIDFRAVLQQMNNQEAITVEQQTSIKQKVIELSAADVYVETEVQIVLTPTGNSATVILTAYDAFTGLSLVNKIGHSPKFYTENYEKLTEKALHSFLDGFTSELQAVFIDILKNGRTIAVDIGIAEDSEVDMDSEVGDAGDLLSDVLENWLEENAEHSYFHIQGITATKMIVDKVRIPAIDKTSKKNYRPSKFANLLREFLTNQGLEVTRDIQGAKIFITIRG